MTRRVIVPLLALSLLTTILAVDKNNFKTCEQSSFCRRLRKYEQNKSPYYLDLSTLELDNNGFSASLKNSELEAANLKLTLTAIAGNIFKVTVDEVQGLHPRYKPQFSLNGEPQAAKLEILGRSSESISVKAGDAKAVITAKPLKLEFYHKEHLVSVVNGKGLFGFEHYRTKPADGEKDPQIQDDPGAWEENFKSHHDSKPKGPSAIAADFNFPGARRVYGLPEHGDRLALRTTGSGGLDPYRLYNLDVFEYEMDSTMAIYGGIPVVYAVSPEHTTGIFWHNAAETWVDINNSKDGNVVSSLVNLVSGSKTDPNVDVRFMSESGAMEFFVLTGPTPKDAVKQYASLTGVHGLPQLFALGYHQSRWNYNDQDDVTTVVAKFDQNNMPVDVMWLDIEYTDGKKYFTWDPIKFSQPENMVNNLTSTGRKLVVIIDPHIKREGGYFVHEDALNYDLYVKNKDGGVYEGWCWPGSSSYLDFYNPATMDYYKKLYSLETFKGTSHDVWIWNDMNEPSVFNGPEITMPKDVVHYGGWEHRDIHNEYPLSQVIGTYRGLIDRSPHRRPFILTRGHFSGTQRYAAIWTGDNDAKWSHLAASFPMCLSEALGGISFCGADVGGFFNNPDVELLQRWYQGAIWLPFFRAHAHIDTRRREPFLFPEDVMARIRNALRLRYAHLPLWYTLFWEHETQGEPVIRPLFYHYPQDDNVLDIDDTVLVGHSVLARPVTDPGESSVKVYLPGESKAIWYDLEDFRAYQGGIHTIPVTLDRHVVFYRGGSIVPRKDRPRRSATVMRNDPFTLYVALDSSKSASGTLYVDDYESFEYKNDKKYVYVHFNYENNKLTSSLIDKTDYPTKEWIERVVVLGAPKGIKGARLTSKSLGTVELETSYDSEFRSLTVRKPGVSIREPFTIELY
ncbi:neutral alpha-glucosidase AB [Anthonomus grandis grandis]|uniref:neutral alpha-glucosidase AB n=1 Tax=Anthonomus grandis grandis TaxID=2921223 RepID=UPI0021663B52|nr:neutral alpha-glucosidase AB [Anthonomus grandis grandis]